MLAGLLTSASSFIRPWHLGQARTSTATSLVHQLSRPLWKASARPLERASRKQMTDLEVQFGAIDVYLFDQLLRGRIRPGMRIFDAGCGSGRNLVYLLREGYEVFGVDSDVHSIDAIRRLAARLPDGSTRYLVDESLLLDLTRRLGGTLVDPLKTTVVQDQHCMTTWVVAK